MADRFSIAVKVPDLDVASAIRSASRQALEAAAPAVLQAIQQMWTGFENPTGRSLAGWQVDVVDTGASVALRVSNREAYVAHIHRAGASDVLIETVASTLEATQTAVVTERLAAAAVEAFNG